MKIRIKDILQHNRLFFILYFIILTACIVIKLIYSKETIYFEVNSRYSNWADEIFPYITDLGNGWTIIIISSILVLFNYRVALLLATTYAVTSVFAQIIKHIVKAPRPKLFFNGSLSHIHFVKGLYIDMFDSFPSGHTVTAFSTALLITYLVKNKIWGIFFLIIAIMVGFSRMYLSEHFFEDVTAGSLIGIIIALFWISWLEGKAFLHQPIWNKGLLR